MPSGIAKPGAPPSVSGTTLTDTQRAAVVNWIAQVWNYYGGSPPANFQLDTDSQLLGLFTTTKSLYSSGGSVPVDNSSIGSKINNAAGAIAGAGVSAASAITNPLDFLKLLTNPELWVRVAEVAVGVLLLGIGVDAFLKETTGVNLGKTAGKAAGAAALA